MSALMDFLSFCLQPSLGCYLLKLPVLGNISTSHDSYARATTVSGDPFFRSMGCGWALNNGSSGRIYVAHAAEQNITEGSIFFGAEPLRLQGTGNFERLVSKRDGSNVVWDLQYDGNLDRINLFDGTSRIITIDIDQRYRSIGAVFENGVKWQCYFDGVWVGEGSTASSISLSGSPPINIQSHHTGSSSHNHNLQALALFSAKLTAQEVSDLHAAFDRISINTAEPQLTSACPLQIVNPLVHLEGEVIAGKALDVSNNALHFTKSNGVEMVPDVPSGTHGFDAHGGNREPAVLTLTDTTLDDLVPISFSFWALRDGPTALNSGRIYEKGPATKFLIQTNNVGSILMYDSWSGGLAQFFRSNVLTLDRWYYIAIRYARTAGSIPQISIDGSTFGNMTLGLAASGTKNTDTGTAYIFNSSTANREYEGSLDDFQIYNRYITQEESDSNYLRAALRSLDRGYSHIYPDSISSKSAGNVGPLSIISGTHSWSSNVLVCSSSGGASMPSNYAYGAWYVRIKKVGVSNTAEVLFIASSPSDKLTTDQYGYAVLLAIDESVTLRRHNGASPTNLITTASSYITNGTWYELFTTRDSADVFRLWIRGGIDTTWTLVGTSAADSTYTASNYVVFDPDSTDEMADLLIFPYGGSLSPNDVPWLAD